MPTIIDIITILSSVLRASAIFLFTGIICLVAAKGASTVYKKVALRYEVSVMSGAEVVAKFFDGRPAEASDPEPLFEDCQLVVMCGGREYTFDDSGVYGRYEVDQTVSLLTYNGFNKDGKLKDTYFSLAS